jgi:hypothetical protein
MQWPLQLLRRSRRAPLPECHCRERGNRPGQSENQKRFRILACAAMTSRAALLAPPRFRVLRRSNALTVGIVYGRTTLGF